MKNPSQIIGVLLAFIFLAAPSLWPNSTVNQDDISKTDAYYKLTNLPDSALIDMGEKWFANRATHSYAFAAFSVVVNRYYRPHNGHSPALPDVVQAMQRIGVLYLTSFYKYDLAYKYLTRARQIADKNNLKHWLPYIDVNLANMWEVSSMISPASSRNGFACLKSAWDNAIDDGNEELLTMISTNMAILSYAHKDSSTFRRQLDYFLSAQPKKPTWKNDFAKTFIAGVKAWQAGDFDSAESHLLKARDIALKKRDNERYRMGALSAICTFYIENNRKDSAAQALREYSGQVNSNPDFAIDLYNLYTEYYQHLHIPDSVAKYHYLYLKEKDNVADDRKLAHVGEREFLDNIERINDEVSSMSEKNRKQRLQITVMAVIALCLMVNSAIILWAYKRLRSKSEQLFRKNVAMIEEQKHFSLRQKELQDEVKKLKSRNTASALSEDMAADDCSDSPDKPQKKIQKVTISNDDAENVYMRLIAIMGKGGEIFSPDFSLIRLAQLADSKPRTVSAVIKMKYGANFPQFLNDYRIREACIRFQDIASYGNYTVEAISESVGYRSRTGFSSLFKKFTGLSPSEYQRLARRSKR